MSFQVADLLCFRLQGAPASHDAPFVRRSALLSLIQREVSARLVPTNALTTFVSTDLSPVTNEAGQREVPVPEVAVRALQPLM
jgi:hypothetical protein